jgi:hypothetical protein
MGAGPALPVVDGIRAYEPIVQQYPAGDKLEFLINKAKKRRSAGAGKSARTAMQARERLKWAAFRAAPARSPPRGAGYDPAQDRACPCPQTATPLHVARVPDVRHTHRRATRGERMSPVVHADSWLAAGP